MAIKEALRQLIPEQHAERIVLEDHFGHRHEIKVYHVLASDEGGELVYEPVDHSAAVESARRMMERREELFLKSCLAHPVHKHHPAVVSHPLHPANVGSVGAAFPEWPRGDCGECP